MHSSCCRVEVGRLEQLETRVLLAAGFYDPTFSTNGRLTTDILGDDAGTAVAIQLNGKIVVAGESNNGDNRDIALTQYHTDGTLDTANFGVGGAEGNGRVIYNYNNFDELVTCVAIQADGKILVGGQLTQTLNQVRAYVARFNKDGTLDPSFGSNGFAFLSFGVTTPIINDIAIQPDGKIVAAGTVPLDSANDQRIGVARLTKFGEPDFTFVNGGYTYYDAGSKFDAGYAVAIQQDGKILIGGAGDGNQNEPGTDTVLLRINPNDASLDAEFGEDGKVFLDFRANLSDLAFDLAINPAGRIAIVGGQYVHAYVALCDPDGSLITSRNFSPGSSTRLASIALQPDGAIVIAGGNSGDGGSDNDVWYVRRFVGDLDDDPTFGNNGVSKGVFAEGQGNYAFGMALQPDGKIVLAGRFQSTFTQGAETDFGVARIDAYPEDAGSISGRIFKDKNANGVRNSDDSGHSNVRVYIDENKDGKFHKRTEPSAMTDPNGKYTIPGLEPGPYRIRQVLPNGYRRTLPDKHYYNIMLDPGESAGNKDFGNTQKILIRGTVFRDEDGDGQWDDGEPALKRRRTVSVPGSF